MLGEHLGTVALALLYLLAVFGWGGVLLRLLPATQRSPWEDVAARIIGGCGVLYTLFIGLSAAGLLHPVEVGAVLGLGLVASVFSVLSLLKSVSLESWDLTDRILAISALALAGLQVIFALTPLIFYDLQVYHFLAPAQFLSAGTLAHIPWNVQTNTPLALQLTVGMSLVLDSSGQLTKLLFAILSCLLPLGVFELLRPAGRRAALLGALFVLSFPEFWVMQTLGVVDLAIGGLMVCGTLWARRAMLELQWQPAILAGIAFGMAIGSRYQAVVLTAWMIMAIVLENAFHGTRRTPNMRAILHLGVIATLVVLLVSPWMIRNYAQFGNPVYPLMQSMWGGAEWSAEQSARLSAEALGPGIQTLSATQKVLAPVTALLIFPSNGLFGMTLLFGALVGLALTCREVRLTSLIGLGGLLIWGLIRPTPGVALLRYNATSIALLLAATGAVLAHGDFLARVGPRVAAVLSGGSLVIAMVHVNTLLPVIPSLMDASARHAVQESQISSLAAFRYINQHLRPDQDNVLFIGETRGFWLHVPYIAPSSFNGPQLEAIFASDPDPSHWKESLERLGVTHLLLSVSELQRLHKQYGYLDMPAPQLETFNRWVASLPCLFNDGHGTLVLALEKPPDEQLRSN